MKTWRLLTMLTLIPLLALIGGCSSDDGTTPQDEDTTAPLITQVSPTQDETDVPVGEAVVVTFNEDMDPATATGNVSLSNGTITGYDWTDARTLSLGHTAWTEGVEVTATVQTGLQDEAGNGLAAPFTWSFWTYTDDVLLQNTLPDDGATDVPLNSQIWLQFSDAMNGDTLPGAIAVTSPDKVVHAYTLTGEYANWTLTPDADLPASTVITVTVTTAAQAMGGAPLAAETSFSFTTGSAVDNTPPNLIGIVPANGALIPTDTSFLRLTFDEPVDDESLDPSMVSGQLMMAMGNPDNAGVWSEGHTVFTIGLVPPLVPGAVFAVTFDSYADMHGNVQTTPFEWSVTVAGEPVFFPVVDHLLMYYLGTWTDEPSKSTGSYEAVTQLELKTGGEFWSWQMNSRSSPGKRDGAPSLPWDDYDRMKLTSSAIQFLGFHEVDEDPAGKATDTDITFSPAIDWLRIPLTTATWSGTSQFLPTPVEGPDQVAYTVTVHDGAIDIESPMGGHKQDDSPPVTWIGCRHVTLEYELGDGVTTYQTGEDNFWYCPGVGLVRKTSLETQGSDSELTTMDLIWAGLAEDFPGDR